MDSIDTPEGRGNPGGTPCRRDGEKVKRQVPAFRPIINNQHRMVLSPRRLLNGLSPSNFPWFNPEVVGRTAPEEGANACAASTMVRGGRGPRLPELAVSWAAMSAASADGLNWRAAALSVASPPPSTAGPRGAEVFAAGYFPAKLSRAQPAPWLHRCTVQHFAWTKNEDDGGGSGSRAY
jgi:hypothetical protein